MRFLPAVLLGLAALGGTALARPQASLDVDVDPSRGVVRGTASFDIENTSRLPLSTVELWRFPARLARPSPKLDEHNFYWVYPRRFAPAAMRIDHVTADDHPVRLTTLDHPQAGPGTLVAILLPAPLRSGGRVRVTLEFVTTVPRRFGSFGCYREACHLAGGFYPMPVALGPSGYDYSAPPARLDAVVRVVAPADRQVFINHRALRQAELRDAAVVVLTVDRGLRERALVHRGATVRLFTHDPPPPPPLPAGKALPYQVEDRPALVLGPVRDALDLTAELGLDLPPGLELVLVEAPLRMELAQAHDRMVYVSDQLFRITPLKRFRKFHAFQLLRALFERLFEERLRERERSADLAWSPDVGASWLVDLFTLRDYRRAEFAADVLKWVSFIPAVDRLLYAPQIPFVTSYFNSFDEPDPTREDWRRFSNDRPRGKTIYEKLRDRLGDPRLAQVGHALWRGTPIREAAEQVAGTSLDRFFDEWLGPYPEVDYRFEVVASTRLVDRWRHRIRIWKRGARPPEEPVELRVTEWGGAVHDLRWGGEGREGVLAVETRRAIRTIQLDPRGRLRERLAGENVDERLDDRRPARLKFLYNNAGILFNVETLSIDLSLDFSLARVYDVKNAIRFRLYHNDFHQVGLSTSYARGFGRLVTPARLVAATSLAVTAARIEPRFGRLPGEPPLPGTYLSIGSGIGYEDRLFFYEPWRGTAMSAAVRYGLTLHDSGRMLQQASAGASIERISPLAVGHGLAFVVGASATVGDLKVPSQMLSAGGAGGWLRGYQSDELLGRLVLGTRLEYRHVWVHDLAANVLHLATLRAVTGGLFVEAAMVSPCEGYDLWERDAFADVGYSLRFHHDLLGVVQTTLNVDLAVPLWRRRRGCFQAEGFGSVDPAARPPIGFLFYWGPIW